MLNFLNRLLPPRYLVFGLCGMGFLLSLFTLVGFGTGSFWALVFFALTGLGFYDLRQTKRSVLRNYPVIGHLRFMLEYIRPERKSVV